MASYKSTAAVWSVLQEIFASTSGARILQLRNELQNLHKGDTSISDYLAYVTKLVDALRATGTKVDDSEIILFILGGLDTKYEAIVVVISSQSLTITLPVVWSLLQN